MATPGLTPQTRQGISQWLPRKVRASAILAWFHQYLIYGGVLHLMTDEIDNERFVLSFKITSKLSDDLMRELGKLIKKETKNFTNQDLRRILVLFTINNLAAQAAYQSQMVNNEMNTNQSIEFVFEEIESITSGLKDISKETLSNIIDYYIKKGNDIKMH